MNDMMKQILFTLLLALVANVDVIFAWDYEHVPIGDLYYNLDAANQMAEVTESDTLNNYRGLTIANIPTSVEYNSVNYSVTNIGNGAFAWLNGLTSLTIGNSVKCIGDDAFIGCTGLSSVMIPNGVTTISDNAFSDCSNLTSVTIGNSVTGIGDRAFNSCSSLNAIYYAGSIEDWNSVTVNSGNYVTFYFYSENNYL